MTGARNDRSRILIVDDNEAIHADFRKILGAVSPSRQAFAAAATALFGDEPPAYAEIKFDLEFAYQGQEALDLVRKAQSQGRSFQAAFIDVRMPPGWDGIETAAKIWEVDPRIEVVVCTAYSDYSWHQIAVRLNRPDKFVVLKKPFDGVEILQLAYAFTEKARLQRELEQYTRQVEENELRIRTILNALPQPVFVVDEEVRIMDFNTAAGQLFATDRDHIVRQRGGDVLRCLHSNETPDGCGQSDACRTCVIQSSVASVIAGSAVTRRKARLELQASQGIVQTDMLVTAAPIELQGRRLALLILEDVTELVTLRSLLPICARCKSVRSDKQYWQSIESYLHAHMNMDFSHGLCPKCMQELYPDIYQKMLAHARGENGKANPSSSLPGAPEPEVR